MRTFASVHTYEARNFRTQVQSTVLASYPYPGVQKAEGTPGTHCLRMRLICYWAIALWTLVTSTYGLGFVDDVLASY